MNNQNDKFCGSKGNDPTNDKNRLWFNYQNLKSILCLKCCIRYFFFFLYVCVVGVSVYFLSCTVFCLSKNVISLHNQQKTKQVQTNLCNNSEQDSQDKRISCSISVSGNMNNNKIDTSLPSSNFNGNHYLWFIALLGVVILILIFSIPMFLASIDKRFIQLYLDDKELEINRELELKKLDKEIEIKTLDKEIKELDVKCKHKNQNNNKTSNG